MKKSKDKKEKKIKKLNITDYIMKEINMISAKRE